MILIAIFVALIFFHSLVSARLDRTVLTAPLLFTAAGMTVNLLLPGLREQEGNPLVLLRMAEIGLVLLLFTDASRTDPQLLRSIRNLPVRLLSTGLLLTILLGTLAALALFRHLSLWEAGILGAILAPTDAGLGQIIVSSPRVPLKIRQALNVEAGLNDGLAVPFLLFFMALAGTGMEGGQASLTRFILEQLGYGTAIGAGIGFLGGRLVGWAARRGWITPSRQRLCVVSMPLLCMLGSHAVGASAFIAAFTAGLAVQAGFREAGKHSVEFTEEWGHLLNLSVFFLFGVVVSRALWHFDLSCVLYALLSLTVVRMLPVAVALRGTRLSRGTVLFMGWFGPRGLASIVLALIYLHEAERGSEATLRYAVMATVLLSIVAHGLSAMPGIEIYARRVAALGADAPERSPER